MSSTEEIAKLFLLVRDGDQLSRGLAANHLVGLLIERDSKIAQLEAMVRALEVRVPTDSEALAALCAEPLPDPVRVAREYELAGGELVHPGGLATWIANGRPSDPLPNAASDAEIDAMGARR